MTNGTVHESNAELLSAEDAIQDAKQLQDLFRQRRQAGRPVPLNVPLSALLEALDHLEEDALREVHHRAAERLASVKH